MDISTAEMVGHLRKAARLFKSFEKSAEAAELLNDYENKVESLKKEAGELEDEIKNLNIQCEITTSSIKEAEEKVRKIEIKSGERSAEVNSAMAKLMDAAKVKAEGIVNRANSEVELVAARTKAMKNDEARAKDETGRAIAKLGSVKQELADFKANLAAS